jgi:putative zinc finger/helix-turn-helix YgiT family protein
MKTQRENVPFLGLPGVVLVGVPVTRCPNCGEYEVTIPHIDELHRVLALHVVEHSSRLAGAEIKFLRTVLDYTSAAFARLVGASPVTVSRWEHGAQPIGHRADAFIRALVLLRVGAGVGRAQIERLARAAASGRRAGTGRPIAMRSTANKWKPTDLRAA